MKCMKVFEKISVFYIGNSEKLISYEWKKIILV